MPGGHLKFYRWPVTFLGRNGPVSLYRVAVDQKCISTRKYREDHALELIWGPFSTRGRWGLESGCS